MSDNDQTIKINAGTDLSFVYAGDIVNAYYSALILEKSLGVDITPEVRARVLNEVRGQWLDLQEHVVKSSKNQSPTK